MREEKDGDVRDVLGLDHALAGEVGAGDLHHVGEHAAGADEVHAHAVFIFLRRQRLRKARQRVLGCGVGALQRIALVGVDGRDVQNRPRVRLPQVRQCELAQRKRRAGVEAHDLIVLRERRLAERRGERHAGVVDENIQPPEVRERFFDTLPQIRIVRQVAGQQQHIRRRCVRQDCREL